MSTFNLLDMAKSYFNNELVNKASASLGESEGGISKTISALLPSLIGGLADKASSGTDGAATIAKMASAQHESGILDSIGGFLHHDSNSDLLSKSSGMISSIFGNGGNSNMLTTLISSFAGVKGSSVGTIMSMAVPTLLGLLGRHTAENNVPVSGLASMLGEQKKSAMSMLPAGFSLSSLTGGASSAASSVGSAVSAATSAASHTSSAAAGAVAESAGGGMKWLLPLLLVAGLAAGAYYFFSKGGDKKEETETTTGAGGEASNTAAGGDTAANKGVAGSDTSKAGAANAPTAGATIDPATGLVKYDLGAMSDLDLPGGVKLTGIYANGFENTLVNFIKSGTIDTVNKAANWFNLHDVQFVSGKTEYATPKAMEQIKNVGAILKAYPNIVIKVGGNTDVSGNAAANIDLSQRRANQVMKDILANGAGATQIKEAKGYGSEFATAKAGDKAGMAADRKTTAKVASK
jgi:outer membrane protein OmpA-like peptidoglycan-associated protein